MFEIFKHRKSNEKQFFDYYEKENDFRRLSILYGIPAIILSPIFCFFSIGTKIPTEYVVISFSFIVSYPIYIFICWIIKSLRSKLFYFFVGHLFIVTIYAFNILIASDFEIIHFIFFYTFTVVLTQIIQRLYATVLFFILVSVLLIYGVSKVESNDLSTSIILLIFFIYISTTLIALVVRHRLINNIQGYSDYLKKVLNKPGSGFLLYKFKNSEMEIIDYNEKINFFFQISNTDHNARKENFTRLFTDEEKNTLENLNFEDVFRKQVEKKLDGKIITLELKIVLLLLKTGKHWLCRIEDVTDDVAFQVELSNREKKYRNLYYKNQAGVFTLNFNSQLIDCNDAFHQIFENQFSINDFFFSSEDIQSWNFILKHLHENEFLRNEKFVFQLQTGKSKTLIFNWYIDKVNANIEGTVIDITQVENASKAIQQSEEKFRVIYEESNDAIFLLKDMKIIDTNRKGLHLFGSPSFDLIGTSIFQLSADLSEERKVQFDRILKELDLSKSIRFSWFFKGINDVIESEVAMIEMMIDNEVMYQCVIRDVTLKNRNIRALETNEKNYLAILQNIPEGFLIFNKEKTFYANPEFFKLFPYQTKEEIDISELFSGRDQELFDAIYEQHIQDRLIKEQQLTIFQNNQTIINVDVTLVKTIFGQHDATLIIIKDISVQNKLSKEILRAEIAEETNKRLKEEINERIRTEKLLQDQYLRSKAILDSSSNTLLFIFDVDLNISSFNKHSDNYLFQLTGLHLEVNKYFGDIFNKLFDEKQIRYFHQVLLSVKNGGSERLEIMFDSNGLDRWLELFINPIFDTDGKVYEISMVAHDITLKKSNESALVSSVQEKEILLKEIHHRVKNNLQIISSILNLQSSFVTDEKILEILQDSRNRIRSMAMIHESLYKTTNFSSINFTEYIYNISSNLLATYRINEEHVSFKTELDQVELTLDQAIPSGLLVNELITNAIKYAFPDNKINGVISVRLKEEDNLVSIYVEDNGIGLPDNFDIENLESLGLQLVVSLTEQLNGTLTILEGTGTKFLITFVKANN